MTTIPLEDLPHEMQKQIIKLETLATALESFCVEGNDFINGTCWIMEDIIEKLQNIFDTLDCKCVITWKKEKTL